MLAELAVRDLGVIDELSLVLGPGMTALTGETGAGKTLVVNAIDLLLGGRADPGMVRAGADEAVVEARFVTDDDETVLRRVVPRSGRSRAYVDGSLATLATLEELGGGLVDLHGQHANQSLLRPAAQRSALDRHAGVDLEPLAAARRDVTAIEADLAALGGDARTRARELELARYQLAELEAAGLDDPDEDAALRAEERLLSDASTIRRTGLEGVERLVDARDVLAVVSSTIGDAAAFAPIADRVAGALAEVDDLVVELRRDAEQIVEDPERLAGVQARRALLTDLRRKYGEALPDVISFRDALAQRVEQLEHHDERAAELDRERARARARVAEEAAVVGAARRAGAPGLAAAVQAHFADLAMPTACLVVDVAGDDPADDVSFTVSMSSGAPLRPLTKVASGGELARVMLALRLVLTAGPPVLVFDEVDAGIGGAAALAVGRALAQVASDHQVLVVTHLPQVAAHAHHHVRVVKHDDGATTSVRAERVDADDRLVELSRMLSGQPDSAAAREHARELIQRAAPQAR